MQSLAAESWISHWFLLHARRGRFPLAISLIRYSDGLSVYYTQVRGGRNQLKFQMAAVRGWLSG